jgi:ABC-type transport system involved in cytochrome bd biosynthesis fused ATPase/permease subunit
MRRTNAYVLRNLALSKKLAISVGLLSGLVLFVSGWVISQQPCAHVERSRRAPLVGALALPPHH